MERFQLQVQIHAVVPKMPSEPGFSLQVLALLLLPALFSERLSFGGGKTIVASKSLYPSQIQGM